MGPTIALFAARIVAGLDGCLQRARSLLRCLPCWLGARIEEETEHRAVVRCPRPSDAHDTTTTL